MASPSLLDSLSLERAPVGKAIVKRANEGMRAHRHLWKLLGLTKDEREKTLLSLTDKSEEGQRFNEKIQRAVEATDAEVQSIGIQMNQFYNNVGSRACLDDDDLIDGGVPQVVSTTNGLIDLPSREERKCFASEKVPENPNLLKHVVISTAPGFHLPHVWLSKGNLCHRVSTLDLCGKGKFTLLVGSQAAKWKEAVRSVSQRKLAHIRVFSIGSFDEDYQDVYFDWRRICQIKTTGAILVRPDHFVAWRRAQVDVECQESHLQLLVSALEHILG
jgi:hypothetical protein